MGKQTKTFILEGETVEGKKCDVFARKTEWKGLRKDPITNKLMMLYELDRNCSMTIVEALQFSTKEDKKLRNDLNVHIQEGDKIQGDAISMYVDSKRKDIKLIIKEGVTSTHGGQLTTTKKRTIGKIKYSFNIYKKLLGHSSNSDINNLEIKK